MPKHEDGEGNYSECIVDTLELTPDLSLAWDERERRSGSSSE